MFVFGGFQKKMGKDMKYIISESRLREYMLSFLDSFVENKKVIDDGIYIVVTGGGDSTQDYADYMEYDIAQRSLWVNKFFMNRLMNLFPFKDKDDAQSFVANWFDNKFKTETSVVRH